MSSSIDSVQSPVGREREREREREKEKKRLTGELFLPLQVDSGSG